MLDLRIEYLQSLLVQDTEVHCREARDEALLVCAGPVDQTDESRPPNFALAALYFLQSPAKSLDAGANGCTGEEGGRGLSQGLGWGRAYGKDALLLGYAALQWLPLAWACLVIETPGMECFACDAAGTEPHVGLPLHTQALEGKKVLLKHIQVAEQVWVAWAG